MKRLIVFISGVCLLIMSVSCSSPTGPKTPGAKETALFTELIKIPVFVPVQETLTGLPDGITKKTSDGKTVYTVTKDYTPQDASSAAGVTGTFSITDKKLTAELKKGGKVFTVDNQPMEKGKEFIFSIDGVKYKAPFK